MRIEIITIGHEILCGAILDTNFTYLARKIAEAGYRVTRHTTISDEPHLIAKAVHEALTRADIILTTGGLGPTVDDCTKQVMVEVFEKTLGFNQAIYDSLVQRYGSHESLRQQATTPLETEILSNEVGTAPGFLFQKEHRRCFVMPGVPLEMQGMFEKEVLPRLKRILPAQEKEHVRSLYFCHLSENAVDPDLRKLEEKFPPLKTGIYPGYGVLSVELRVSSCKEAHQILESSVGTLLKKFGTHLFSQEDKNLALAIHHHMITHKKTLALAESCTGGHIAAKLVDYPGASEYFLGSVVCYSNLLKEQSLGVEQSSLNKYGAVSQEVVAEMLKGILKRSHADYALAVSGVAGPSGGTPEKPVGTVWCGLAVQGEPLHIVKILAKGRAKRASMIEYTANFMLGMLWRKVAYKINP